MILLVENNGAQGRGLLTWNTIADTILGVATFLENEDCLQGDWQIFDATLGGVGTGWIGSELRVAGGNASAEAALEAA